LIDQLNQSASPVLAVDVPSGLNADSGLPEGAAVHAMLTITVGAPKAGLLRESASLYVGRLEAATEVGLPPCPVQTELQWTVPEDFAGYPPRRGVNAHKGVFGHLAIVAGSLGYHGAAVLATRGAQRAQPGLVTLLAPESVYVPVASQLQAAMVSPLRLGPDAAAGLQGPWTAMLVGPGLAAPGLPEALKASVRDLWSHSPLPLVVDASALAWLPQTSSPAPALRVLTPHPGEAARMLGVTTEQVQRERVESLRKLSAQYGNAWVVLKGHQTLVGRSSGNVFVNSSGNPHLAQGGSGDVLAGFIAGLLAQPALREDPCKLLRFAVWRHGAAADQLQHSGKRWVVEDLAAAL
jgi:ADP-dependent NAD(P)H-hydrate dehydratase / NAD(P)H-hydrate epimerase